MSRADEVSYADVSGEGIRAGIMSTSKIDVDDATFKAFRELIYEVAGIEYPPTKKSMFLNRVRKRLTALGLDSPAAYLRVLKSGASSSEMQEFLDVITTNETYFFRAPRHWEFFKAFITKREAEVPASRRLRIWSAAASSGAEAYSIAIVLHETFGSQRVRERFEIVGTDLSHTILAEARRGHYTDLTMRGLGPGQKERWFKPIDNDMFAVDDALRTNVSFRPHNLKTPWKGDSFDMIFLRNVMIYFDRPTKEIVLGHAYNAAMDGSALLLGESESLVQVDHKFQNGGTSVLYRERPEHARPS